MTLALIPALATFLIFYILVGFLMSIKYQRNDIADMMWGPGIAGLSWVAYVMAGSGYAWILPLIITIWALRLAFHIALRMSEKEDTRYTAWRYDWEQKGKRYFYLRSFFQVFVLQGLLMVVIALPVILAMYFNWGESITWWQILGCLVWVEGFTIEVLADWQLDDFLRRKHAGMETSTFMTRGIWGWSRHPNYFGEVEQWWGIFLIALTPAAPWTWFGIVSALTITFLILKVSGIPMLEQQFADDPEYQEYQRRVGPFVPLPPKWKKKKRER